MIGSITLIWLGTMAVALTFGAMIVAVPRYQVGEASLPGTLGFGFGFLFWILFALHSTSYVRPLGDGSTETVATQSLTVAALLGAIITLVLLFDAAMRILRANS